MVPRHYRISRCGPGYLPLMPIAELAHPLVDNDLPLIHQTDHPRNSGRRVRPFHSLVLSQDQTIVSTPFSVEICSCRLDILPLHHLVLSPAVAVDVPHSVPRRRRRHIEPPTTLRLNRRIRSKRTSLAANRRIAKPLRPANRQLSNPSARSLSQ
jgi:hypothetical protein